MDYVKEYTKLIQSKKQNNNEDTTMQRADKRYKRLLKRGIITKEEPFIISNVVPSDIRFNR